MTRNNSPARRDQRRTEAQERTERSADAVIDCRCGRRHHRDWAGCPAFTEGTDR